MKKKVNKKSKNLIDYDTVLTNQRELVYKQRDQILKNLSNTQIAINMAKKVSNDIVEQFKLPKNPLFVDPLPLAETINTKIFNFKLVSSKFFEHKTIAESKNILFQILVLSINKRVELLTPERANLIFRDIMIQSLDHQWTDHLDLMVKIREGVTLRSLEQRSPLNIYVNEADNHFNEMKSTVAHNVIMNINHIFIPKVNEEIFNSLNQILSSLNISHEYYDELKEQEANRKINQAFNQQANVVIKENNSNNSTNNDSQLSAKDILLKKMKEAQKK